MPYREVPFGPAHGEGGTIAALLDPHDSNQREERLCSKVPLLKPSD